MNFTDSRNYDPHRIECLCSIVGFNNHARMNKAIMHPYLVKRQRNITGSYVGVSPCRLDALVLPICSPCISLHGHRILFFDLWPRGRVAYAGLYVLGLIVSDMPLSNTRMILNTCRSICIGRGFRHYYLPPNVFNPWNSVYLLRRDQIIGTGNFCRALYYYVRLYGKKAAIM